ncbi:MULTISPECIES: hypothetical protein [Colwellia]|uniref:SMODS and SLOG-associating 2TM effector domain-containing protein n=1 Tax=Colwellia marinimaniae TaxID=1513592 RepID=A0ABQ0MZM0_9GAMM|nr:MULTISPECIES: hypothetical protein [Colwellia]GAW97076.1 hypothetical protein MTCD1_02702 [Colwellia marinimaniae]
MTTNLKKENNTPIFSILAAALLLCAGFQLGFDRLPDLTEALVAGTASTIFSAVLVMLTNLLSHNIKHKIIFTRFTNEMPACRINKLCRKDSRIDYQAAKERWSKVFDSATPAFERNSLWYRHIYKPVKDTNEVRQAHRSFLLYRDVFSGLVMLFITAFVWHLLGDPELIGEIVPEVFWVLGIFSALSLIAARNSGNRFVVNAVATALD